MLTTSTISERVILELKQQRAKCDALLAAASLPGTGMEIVDFNDRGEWRHHNPSEPTPKGYRHSGVSRWAAQKLSKPLSQEWYAAIIGALCADVLEAGEIGFSAAQQARDVNHVQQLLLDRRWRARHGAALAQRRQAASAGGVARSMQVRPARQKVLSEMVELRARHPDAHLSELATWAAKKGIGKSAAANRQTYYRHGHGIKL